MIFEDDAENSIDSLDVTPLATPPKPIKPSPPPWFNSLSSPTRVTTTDIYSSSFSPSESEPESESNISSSSHPHYQIEMMHSIRSGLSPESNSSSTNNSPPQYPSQTTQRPRKLYNDSKFNIKHALTKLTKVDSQLSHEKLTLDKTACKSVNGLLRVRTSILIETCQDLKSRMFEAKKEVNNQQAHLNSLSIVNSRIDFGGARVSHPRWGFDNLSRRSSTNEGGGSKVKRAGDWVNSGNEAGSKFDLLNKLKNKKSQNTWDGSVFKVSYAVREMPTDS